ncbi:MAG: TIR domain-containing protein, partial [Planctomycetales bacterium]|nr:TIR domain-containing protein [Planctomycetales bacterium]
DVFLSHNSQDKPQVEDLAQRLGERGLIPFLDRWCLVPGEPWQEAIEEALRASASCAVFLGA